MSQIKLKPGKGSPPYQLKVNKGPFYAAIQGRKPIFANEFSPMGGQPLKMHEKRPQTRSFSRRPDHRAILSQAGTGESGGPISGIWLAREQYGSFSSDPAPEPHREPARSSVHIGSEFSRESEGEGDRNPVVHSPGNHPPSHARISAKFEGGGIRLKPVPARAGVNNLCGE